MCSSSVRSPPPRSLPGLRSTLTFTPPKQPTIHVNEGTTTHKGLWLALPICSLLFRTKPMLFAVTQPPTCKTSPTPPPPLRRPLAPGNQPQTARISRVHDDRTARYGAHERDGTILHAPTWLPLHARTQGHHHLSVTRRRKEERKIYQHQSSLSPSRHIGRERKTAGRERQQRNKSH